MTNNNLTIKAPIVLRAARDVIADGKNWTVQAYAKNKEGRQVSPHNSDACQFCAVGALGKVLISDAGDAERSTAYKFLNAAAFELFHAPVHRANDEKGHELVLKMYDRAIELAELAEAAGA